VFAPVAEPHLFGFCGDVVLPALLLGQIVSAIDAGVLFDSAASASDRHNAVSKAVERGVASAIATPTIDFTIHHLFRERAWPDTSFRAWNIFFDTKKRNCTSREVLIPTSTEVIGSFGSGATSAKAHQELWQKSDAAGRSRAILASFCDSITSGDDPLSGGPPQLAALYTKGAPAPIGMCINEGRFINGLKVDAMPTLNNINWRNNLGEEVDPMSRKVVQGARRFARPKKLAKS
jgi:hypothetical protein